MCARCVPTSLLITACSGCLKNDPHFVRGCGNRRPRNLSGPVPSEILHPRVARQILPAAGSAHGGDVGVDEDARRVAIIVVTRGVIFLVTRVALTVLNGPPSLRAFPVMGSLDSHQIVECLDEHRPISIEIANRAGSDCVDVFTESGSDQFVRRSKEGRCKPGRDPVEVRHEFPTKAAMVVRQLLAKEDRR